MPWIRKLCFFSPCLSRTDPNCMDCCESDCMMCQSVEFCFDSAWIWLQIKIYHAISGRDERPCAGYFGFHQGTRFKAGRLGSSGRWNRCGENVPWGPWSRSVAQELSRNTKAGPGAWDSLGNGVAKAPVENIENQLIFERF